MIHQTAGSKLRQNCISGHEKLANSMGFLNTIEKRLGTQKLYYIFDYVLAPIFTQQYLNGFDSASVSEQDFMGSSSSSVEMRHVSRSSKYDLHVFNTGKKRCTYRPIDFFVFSTCFYQEAFHVWTQLDFFIEHIL
ncbi:hypothetical protein BpHYR1_001999 [Brachionus plicatilis]|uniref:Uncharacterized protein n=1 Tax=Brachionus plicatilis TaxID=10195 RepID=A0A3M7QEJ3_BRAPC|nr:hypothetical protein BpHYR1_001999 [Brachionus plicatilis]